MMLYTYRHNENNKFKISKLSCSNNTNEIFYKCLKLFIIVQF